MQGVTMRTAKQIVSEYLEKGYSRDRLRALANGRPEPIRSQILEELENVMEAVDFSEEKQSEGTGELMEPIEAGHGENVLTVEVSPQEEDITEPQEAIQPPEPIKSPPEQENEPQEPQTDSQEPEITEDNSEKGQEEENPENEEEKEPIQEVVSKTMRRSIRFEMTDAEIKELAVRGAVIGQEMREKQTHLSLDEDAWKAQKKVVEAELEALETQRAKVENDIMTGKVFRFVECVEKKDWEESKVCVYRNDTGEIIEERDMTESELQVEIPFDKVQVDADTALDNTPTDKKHEEPPKVTEEGPLELKDVEDIVFADELNRKLFISDGGTKKKYTTYFKKGSGLSIYDKKAMPLAESVREALDNLKAYAEENKLRPTTKEE